MRPAVEDRSARGRRFSPSALVKVAVSVGLMGFVLHWFGAKAVISPMLAADPWRILLASALFALSGVIGAYKWQLILRFHAIRVAFTGTVSRYFMGLFFNYMLPSSVGGDVVRIYKTAVASGHGTRSFSSTLADRVTGLIAMLAFSFAAWFFIPPGIADIAMPVAIAVFTVIAGFVLVVAVDPLGRLAVAVSSRVLPAGAAEKVSLVLGELHELTRAPLVLVEVLALGCLVQFVRIGVHYLCGRAVGVEAGIVPFLLFVPLIEVVASMPVSFGGIGVRETIGPMLFATMGVDGGIVVSYTLLATAAGFTGSLPGAVLFAMSVGKGGVAGRGAGAVSGEGREDGRRK